MSIRWRTFWYIIGFWPLLIIIWLVWQLPGQGYFRLDMESLYLPKNGMVLVELKDSKPANSYSLASCGIGWRAFRDLWPLILLCICAGYPLGVVYHWLCQLLARERPSPKEMSPEEQALTARIDELIDDLWKQEFVVQDLRKEADQARRDVAILKAAVQLERHNNHYLEKTTDTLDRELFNARVKIKRLEAKNRRKPIDHPPWPEYSDDM